MPNLPGAEAESLISLPKFVREDIHLTERKNHAKYLQGAARIEDEFGATIPGMAVEIEVKAPILVDACKYLVSVFALRNGVKYRVHQVEIQPNDKRSHNGPKGPLYGPHEHRGDLEPTPTSIGSCASTIEELFAAFCDLGNISFSGTLILP